jgi:hypothetical protein
VKHKNLILPSGDSKRATSVSSEGGQNPLTVFIFLPAMIGGRQGNIWRLISAN